MSPDQADNQAIDSQTIAEQLAQWGKVAMLETSGRVSGRSVESAVGFIEDEQANLVVAAGSESADWVLNLQANPNCRATIADRTALYVAETIEGDERSRALTALILKYGTPAERLGRGPVFRLRPR